MNKLKSRDELKTIVDRLKQDNKSIVFANGCFDILHGGHISYLESSAAEGDVLVVGVNSDVSMKLIKGENRPIIPEGERAEILTAMEMVDYVVLFDEEKCESLLEDLHPDVHAKGTDYTTENVPEREVALKLGIRIAITGAPKENATRGIIKKVKDDQDGIEDKI